MTQSKRIYSDLYEKWIVIFTDLVTNKNTIKKCDTEDEAKLFQDSLENGIQLPWYLK